MGSRLGFSANRTASIAASALTVLALVSACGFAATPQRSVEPAPAAVRGLAAAPAEKSVTLSWHAPRNWRSAEVYAYFVTYRTVGARFWKSTRMVGPQLRQTTISHLANGRLYEFRVFARSRATSGVLLTGRPADVRARPGPRGNGSLTQFGTGSPAPQPDPAPPATGPTAEPTPPVTGPTSDPTGPVADAPDVPANFDLTAGNESVAMHWQPPASDGGSPVTTYEVRFRLSSSSSWSAPSANASTSRLVSELSNGTSYDFAVRAVNAAGPGAWTPAASATPFTTSSAPAAPALAPGDGRLAVSWLPPAADGGSPVAAYQLRYKESALTTWTVTGPAAGLSRTITDLTDGTDYDVEVRAVNAAGPSPWSPRASGAPVAPPAPGPPGDVSASIGADPGEIAVTWTLPASGGAALQYEVRSCLFADPDSCTDPVSGPPDVFEALLLDAQPDTTIVIEVRGVNGGGAGEWAQSAPIDNPVTPPVTPPVTTPPD